MKRSGSGVAGAFSLRFLLAMLAVTAFAVGSVRAQGTGGDDGDGVGINLAEAYVDVEIAEPEDGFVYKGAAWTPGVTVTVTVDGEEIELKMGAAKDYVVAYTENTNAGTAKITIAGTGNEDEGYYGLVEKTFEIAKATLKIRAEDKKIIFGAAAPAYTVAIAGFAIEADKALLDGVTPEADCDYEKGDNVGEYDITVAVEDLDELELDNYEVELVDGTLTVSPKAIVKANVTVADEGPFILENRVELDITVKVGETELEEGIDYQIAYEDNDKVGAATATVTGKGNYGGEVVIGFVIEAAEFEVTFGVVVPVVEEDGEEVDDPAAEAGGNGALTAAVVDGDGEETAIESGDRIANGAKVVFTAAPDAEYVVKAWVVNGKPVPGKALAYTVASLKADTDVTVEFIHEDDVVVIDNITIDPIANAVYAGGAEIKPAVVVKTNDTLLVLGEHYTVTYKDNVNVGTATVTVEGKDRYSFTETVTFVIGKKAPVWADLVIGKDGAVTLKGTGGGAVTLEVNGEEVEKLPVVSGTYSVVVTIAGGANYSADEITNEEYVVSVAQVAREVIKSDAAVVAPVKVFAGEFTVGPNVVSRAGGKAGFFWQGKALGKGSIAVFSASGDLVKRVSVSDRAAGNSVRREVGCWDLKDARGRPVADGSYVVKGVLRAKDGSSVKISSIVNVK